MRPATGERDRTCRPVGIGRQPIGRVAGDLQGACEALHHRGNVFTAPGAIISRERPKVAVAGSPPGQQGSSTGVCVSSMNSFGEAASWRSRRSKIGLSWRPAWHRTRLLDASRLGRPSGLVDLRLPVEGKLVRVRTNQHMSDHRLGGEASLDEPGRRHCLRNAFAAPAAAGPDVEPLGARLIRPV